MPVPTQTYTGGIATLPAGTAVPLSDPSFENAGGQKRSVGREKRQSAAQHAASAAGWTIARCGDGTLGDCTYENYNTTNGESNLLR